MADPRTRLAVAEFLDSPRGRALGARPELVRRAAELIVTSAVEHLGVAPRELDGEQLKELLLGVVPRRLGAKDPAATVVPAVARAFFSHLAEHELVPHAFELELALDEVDEGYDAAVRGVRPEERIAGATETLKNRAAPLGRNDPCPCGSGKKWKKCCGKAGP